jgi:probable phosphomutase (TIGR03848 family)
VTTRATTLILLRHATTPATGKRLGGWTPGVHLDAPGIAQAEAAARRLAKVELSAVYSSPLERTRETAAIVARSQGVRVRTERAIGEVDFGDWTDRPLSELRRLALWRTVQQAPSRVTFPGGESLRGAQARAVDATERIAADHPGEVVLLVSHADVIKAIVAHHLGMPLDAFQRLVIAPASTTTILLPDGAAPVVLTVNDTSDPGGTASSGATAPSARPSRASRAR